MQGDAGGDPRAAVEGRARDCAGSARAAGAAAVRHDAAAAWLYRCVVQFELLDMPAERTRSRSALGKSLVYANRLRKAIPVLRRTAHEFAEQELLWESAMASVELAEALLIAGQPAEVPALCREAIARLTRCGLSGDAAPALDWLQEAARLDDSACKRVRDAHALLRRLKATQPRASARS